MLRHFKFFILASIFGLSLPASAAGIINLGTGDARSLSFKSVVGTVFISNPDIADYQVIESFFNRPTN